MPKRLWLQVHRRQPRRKSSTIYHSSEEWLNKIPADLSILKNPIVCIKRFRDSDVIKTPVYASLVTGELQEFQRERPRLKAAAIPIIFNNVLQYLSETRNR